MSLKRPREFVEVDEDTFVKIMDVLKGIKEEVRIVKEDLKQVKTSLGRLEKTTSDSHHNIESSIDIMNTILVDIIEARNSFCHGATTDISTSVPLIPPFVLSTNEEREVITVTIPAPKKKQNVKDMVHVKAIIKQECHTNEEETSELIKIIKEKSLETCQNMVQRRWLSKLRWGALTMEQKDSLCQMTVRAAITKDRRLSFIYKCDKLWPCRFVLQPKWTDSTRSKKKSTKGMKPVKREEDAE